MASFNASHNWAIAAVWLALQFFSPTAMPVTAQVAGGGNFTCALDTGGGVKCWGNNSSGQLGDGTNTPRYKAADVVGLTSGVVALAKDGEGDHHCALLGNGTVKCWGNNGAGQLGDGTNSNRNTPVAVSGLSNITAVSIGYQHSCALRSDQSVWCWGLNNWGQLGDGTTTNRNLPVQVSGLGAGSGATAIGTGEGHSCAVVASGISCWGRGDRGQLGNGSMGAGYMSAVPVNHYDFPPNSGSAIASLALGWYHSCAVRYDELAFCWGRGDRGQLGNGDTADYPYANLVFTAGGDYLFTPAISAGALFSCALNGGNVQCWGADDAQQLGNGSPDNSFSVYPVNVAGLPGAVSAFQANGGHSCAIISGTGAVYCWGVNWDGQVGDGTVGDSKHTAVASKNVDDTPLIVYSTSLTVTAANNGVISSSAGGIDCGAACTANYSLGSNVTLTATPNAGYEFSNWSGDCSGGTPTCTLTMNAAKAVSAVFTLASYNLNLSKTGTGSGTVISSPAGVDCGSNCTATFIGNTPVTLTAVPATGSTFGGWGMDCSGAGACNLAMTVAKNVAATFILNTYALSVGKQGNGTVNSNVGGIDCGAACSATYDHGTTVTLTATPGDAATIFTGWSGACSGMSNTCAVTMDGAKSASATFAAGYGLSVTPPNNGAITGLYINCGATCNANYLNGASVTLTAAPNTGYAFSSWGGACSGVSGTSCTVTMDAAKGVSATFTGIPTYALTVSPPANGKVTGLYINCGTTCSASYAGGTSVTLTATPNTGYAFSAWGGACTGVAGNSCTVTVDAAKSVSATFTVSSTNRALTVSRAGSGKVTGLYINCGTTCSASYRSGITVTLTATPNTGKTFSGWGGACSGTASSCVVTMDAAKSVTATFTP